MFTTYDLFNNVNNMRHVLNNFFNENYTRRTADYPYVNLYEKDDNIEIAVLAPGEKVENIDLQLIDNSLRIEIDKKADYKDSPYIRKERAFGKFRKSVMLPYRVDPDKIEATMKNGILKIKLVKAEDAKPKKIEIH
ncbi:MAG: Hsp20/alpha crystallin family protein [Spirochaetes bacterium]|nr:Hsp20/alpha crystallin family protein [Spirochaetota bacterium]